MRKGKSVSIAAVGAIGMVLFGGVAAFADNSSHSFSGTVPAYQQSHYLNSYQRSSGTASSTIDFSSISNSQLMNVKAENLQNNAEYTEIKGIGTGSNTSIPNSTPAGDESRLVVTNYDWNALTPSIGGSLVIH
jgi:hypothetical protein